MSEETEERVGGFMGWIESTLAPAAQRLMDNPWLAGLTSGVMKCLPFILTGCLIFFYNAIRSWLPALPDLTVVMRWTFQMLALFYAFMIPHELMESLGHRSYKVTAGLAAVRCYLCVMGGRLDDSGASISFDFSKFGPTGSVVAMFTAVFVALVFHLYARHVHLFRKGSNVPAFLQGWINDIIPIFSSILVTGVVVEMARVDLYDVFQTVFAPVQFVAQSLPGNLLVQFISNFSATVGISGWTWAGINALYQIPAQSANLAAMQAGTFDPATAYVNVSEAMSGLGLVNLGGMGATLALNIWFLMSKCRKLRTLGRVAIGPAMFNINEPIVYGAPIVYNPILMVPAIVCPLVGTVMLTVILRTGLLAFPNVQASMVGTLPVMACTVMLTGDLRGILWWFVFLAVYMVIWYPFFRVFEKGQLAEETAQEPTVGRGTSGD